MTDCELLPLKSAKKNKPTKKTKCGQEMPAVNKTNKPSTAKTERKFKRAYGIIFSINGHTLEASVNTGSSASFINRRYLPADAVIEKTKRKFIHVDGSRLDIQGTIEQDIVLNGSTKPKRIEFRVVPDKAQATPAVFGRDFLNNPQFKADLIAYNQSGKHLMYQLERGPPNFLLLNSVGVNLIAAYTVAMCFIILMIIGFLNICVEDAETHCLARVYFNVYAIKSAPVVMFGVAGYFLLLAIVGCMLMYAIRTFKRHYMIPFLIAFGFGIVGQFGVLFWAAQLANTSIFVDTFYLAIFLAIWTTFNFHAWASVFYEYIILRRRQSPDIKCCVP